jgi:hypothetical protein
MSANINFIAGGGSFLINDLSGSGLGFYGSAGFGASVAVGSWQGRTFITDGAGVNQGPEVNNCQYLNIGSGILGQTGSGVAVANIPNYLSTLNVRFTYDSAVQVINAQLQIYDRVNPNNPASGVTTKVAQLIHPSPLQTVVGSGDTTWETPGGSGAVVTMANSPGVSGLYAGNGTNSTRTDTQHDWYFAISGSPNTIGSKTQYGLYVSLEYQ